ncbi:hypothetical protein PYW07_008642 [Mythimna separata]|uniref:Glucosylceramidase n=1 Tax=Mythimna separata TaxID=271217 RepID=A0AAD7YD48_MYTSE|nr:hypothetical protein PYW07_008642 [Mythimna separata]
MVFLITIVYLLTATHGQDLPCAAQQIPGRSVICVCNATYCDTITRIPPPPGSFVTYTSSARGLRFHKTIGRLSLIDLDPCPGPTYTVNPSVKYQTIEGFGSSVTDAASIMWSSMSKPLRKKFVDSYYGDNGLEYSMIRVPIGGTDFSTHTYAYNELPPYDIKLSNFSLAMEDYRYKLPCAIGGTDFSTHTYAYNELPPYDIKLSNFSLAMEDYRYKIPMIKAIMKGARQKVHIIASCWSPPRWMKTNNAFAGYSRLITDYYQTYADYHLKFLEHYTAEGIPIWGITTGNEPTDGMGALIRLNCLGWNADSMATWIINNLGPTIRNSSFKDIKILCADDQRPLLDYWVTLMFEDHPKVQEVVDGIAVHFYFDSVTPPSVLSRINAQYPDKFIMGTEATAMGDPNNAVNFGDWDRARLYISDIINDINNSLVGWIDWNMCLNKDGGPNWNGNNVDSTVIVLPELGQFIKQPTFYAMGHISKFVPRGSRRIQVTSNEEGSSMLTVAFLTPQNTVVVLLYNRLPSNANIVLGGKQASIVLEPDTITTVELSGSSLTYD